MGTGRRKWWSVIGCVPEVLRCGPDPTLKAQAGLNKVSAYLDILRLLHVRSLKFGEDVLGIFCVSSYGFFEIFPYTLPDALLGVLKRLCSTMSWVTTNLSRAHLQSDERADYFGSQACNKRLPCLGL
jgi:hypothetical protein